MTKPSLENIISLLKRRGFVYPSSSVYGGWESAYDFGPLGAEMLRNIRSEWWKKFVHSSHNVVGLDSAIISHPKVWEASGHVDSFSDVMVEDVVTHKRYRADHLIQEKINQNADGMEPDEIDTIIKENAIVSPDGNALSAARRFNNLVEVEIGTVENSTSRAYLRGETCQPIFYNFKLISDSMRMKLPFGVAQIGKAFRNEIKVGPYIFRTREFEQMELEMFTHPTEAQSIFEELKVITLNWLISLGIRKENLAFRDQDFKERAHYNKVATDLEYNFPFGWKEFQGIHNRGDWDLTRHGKYSGEDFTHTDSFTGERFIPHVVEYSIGLNRLMLVLLCDAYYSDEKRTVLRLDPCIAPYKAAVFPLLRNKPEMQEKAKDVLRLLKENKIFSAWDDRGNIGKRYLSQDEIGTPYCVTIDYDTLESDTVTVRDRDTMEQQRVQLDGLVTYLSEKI